MARPVYSERFLINTAVGTKNFQVPAGKRAVVKGVSAFNTGQAEYSVYINIAGFTVWSAAVPAQRGAAPGTLMLVAYEGELVGAVNQTADLRTIISGFLLDAPGTRIGDLLTELPPYTEYDPDANEPV
jgi:hypothetical protein